METEVDASVPVLAPTTPAPQTSTISDFNYVDNGDGTLTVTNAGTELPLRNIRIEDKIHEGLTVRQDAITVACEELGLDKAPSPRPRRSPPRWWTASSLSRWAPFPSVPQ